MKSNFLKTLAVIALITIISFLVYYEGNNKNTPRNTEQTLILDGGTYDTEIHVIITPDTNKALQFVIERINHPVEPEDFNASGVTFTDEEGAIVMWLDSAEDEGVITHELLHATLSIMLWAGIPLNDTTEESYAYQLQYLTNQFYNKLK